MSFPNLSRGETKADTKKFDYFRNVSLLSSQAQESEKGRNEKLRSKFYLEINSS